MTVFFTHCSRKFSGLVALFACALALVVGVAAHAEGIEVRNAALVAGEEGYFLEADFEIALNPTLEEALNKGVPLYFLLEFEVVRPRWYWLNEQVLNTQQQYRLAYNALTRQYRLGVGSLFQNFGSMSDALDFLSRVRRRQVLEPGTLSKGSTYVAGVRMRLDVSQLPKPFQLNALASRDWNFGSGVVPLERDAVTRRVSGIRFGLGSGGVKYLLVVCAVVGAVTLYLLATASANTALFAQHYPVLLALNGGLAVCLAGLLGYQLYTLRQKLKAGVFGAKLTLRLVLLFALVAVLPGVLVYGVSVQFVARSIESWFDVRVEKALEGGLNLGRTTLDNQLSDLRKKAEIMASSLSVRPTTEHLTALNMLREQAGVQEATLFTPRGKVIAYAGNERTGLMPDLPGQNVLRQLRQQQIYSGVEAIPDKGLYLRVLVPVNTISLADDMRVLQLLQRVPAQLARDAEIVQTGQREYQELLLARAGLKRLYGITLTLTLLLALLTALSLAFLLSERLSAPLSFLVEGTRAVAQGDFSQRETVASSDELGVLTQSFNAMRQQLAEARATAERNQAQLADAHTYVQSILANLSAGVLAFDESLRLRSFNHSACAILDADFAQLSGVELSLWHERIPALKELAAAVDAAFRAGAGNEWSKQIERAGKGGNQMLLLRGTRLPAGSGTGFVVVFDDITHVLQAQRDAAWTEVARRLAHEIKNPLTPIQLSAERLQHKLAAKLGLADADMLQRSTQTIVNQVSALKNMVEAFRQYARMPEPTRQELDFNDLVREVLMLYESLAGRLQVELAPGLPRIVGDSAQLRQVIHNLLQNAEDALAGVENPRIVVRTRALAGGMCVTISDNGSGFPHELMQRVFEPYVTTKPKGTGLGLVIVKKIIEEHGGSVEIANVSPHGARVTLNFPAGAIQAAAVKTAARA